MDDLKELQLLAQSINSTIAGLEPKSVDKNGSVSDGPELERLILAKQKLLEATIRIQNLVSEPIDYHQRFSAQGQQLASLRWLCYFDVPARVPLQGSISYKDLAESAGVPINHLKRVARLAMTSGLFFETDDGQVGHTKLSANLQPGNPFLDACKFLAEVPAPTATKMLEMTKSWDPSAAENKLAFNIAFDTEMPMYAYITKTPQLSKTFAGAMRFLAATGSSDLSHLVMGFDWASLGPAKVIDIGGSSGTASMALASQFPNLSFVVQDLPDVINRAVSTFAQHKDYQILQRRIVFETHDFFQPQPISNHNADVFLLRQILNNWSDSKAASILKQVVKGMRLDARVIVMSTILPKPGTVSVWEETKARTNDLFMLQGMGGEDRDLDSMQALIASVDPQLQIKNIQKPAGSMHSVIEVGY